ncbi:MAG TPA: outer membrane lipoprotein carrier protein LolA, partial [Rhodanobacteraceae bacterium]|nr:outer membrane lipoprotein carrier protein LolA [Rhodanobacteraceae bacterium]
WTLRFTPKQERVARMLGSIELSGGEFLGRIRIQMQDGAVTDIQLEQTRIADELSALERNALGLP